ncbi:MAG: elongation factor P [Candidatus Bipolaricaulia bacterium]
MRVSELTRGMTILYNGELYEIIEYEHSKRGRGDALARTKLKHLISGRVISKVFQGAEDVEQAYLETRPLQYLYNTGDEYYFMDRQSYEQVPVAREQLGNMVYYLQDGMELEGLFFEGRLVKVELPTFVRLKVVEAPPGVKGDTASGGEKPVILETGLEVKVPLFVKAGDLIKVDTRSGKYIERVG